MDNSVPQKLSGTSLDISKENRLKLKQLLPSVFTETRNEKGETVESIDFDKLKAELGTFSEYFENHREHYGIDWPGKKEALKLIQMPSAATLKPVRDESVNFDTTENLYIEGDNLEVLKLLQKSYYGKVKMIYIDPPYNTGKEFIYPDNFTESLDTYLEYAGLIDGDGKKFSTNTANEGRFHTKWLNMMYPRLYLARNLLKDDGVIFISIDDNEVSNLRRMCDEIFGEDNFIGNITWEKRTKAQNTETAKDQFQSKTEYILVYQKINYKMHFNLEGVGKKIYDLSDDKGPYREKIVEEMSSLGMRGRDSMIFPIMGISPSKDKQWKIGKEQAHFFEERNDVIVRDARVYFKIRPGDEDNEKFAPFWSHFFDKDAYGTAESGKAELSEILGTKAHGFETVKPVKLVRNLLFHVKKTNGIELKDNDIVFDFFAGSGTTAQAVLELSKEDKIKRTYILVQLPEQTRNLKEDGTWNESETWKAGYKTIAELGKERIRRVINKMNDEDGNSSKQDRGFRVLKLDRSNFKQWQALEPNTSTNMIEEQLELHIDHIMKDSTPEDLLYEVLIKAGFKPTEKIESKQMAGKQVFAIADGTLLICLEDTVTKELIEEVAKAKPMQFICLDSAFGSNDQLKANTVETFRSHNQGKEKEEQIIFKTI